MARVCEIPYFFFFSSRRRHTRLTCDWSSDVCSSDLRPWIKKLPPEECDALADQWRRASYSVPLNIAEGASRRGPREFRRHLDIARGSLHEIAVVLDLVVALGYLKESDLVPLRRGREDCARTDWGPLRA